MISITIAWLMLIVWGIKRQEKTHISEINTSALRGIAAFEIMIGHIGVETNSIVLYPNRKAGILFVGIFFILSGYGLAYSYSEKKNYLKGFVVSKLSKLLIPAYAAYVIYILFDCIINQSDEVKKILNVEYFVNCINWYVWEILLFYLLFYLTYRFLDSTKADVLILCASALLILFCYIRKVSNPWYGSAICFWLGILYYKKEQKINHVFKGRPQLCWGMGAAVAVSIIVFFVDQDGFAGLVCARNIAAALFSVLILLLLYKYCIGNVVTNWLGNISYEIFLIHPFVIVILRDKFSSTLLYAWLVIVISIFLASILKGVSVLWKHFYECKRKY